MKHEWSEALRKDSEASLLEKRTIINQSRQDMLATIALVHRQDYSAFAHPGFLIWIEYCETVASTPGNLDAVALSPAEREAALLVERGMSNADIAKYLGISIAAVKWRLHGCFKKLKVSSRAQLMILLRPNSILS